MKVFPESDAARILNEQQSGSFTQAERSAMSALLAIPSPGVFFSLHEELESDAGVARVGGPHLLLYLPGTGFLLVGVWGPTVRFDADLGLWESGNELERQWLDHEDPFKLLAREIEQLRVSAGLQPNSRFREVHFQPVVWFPGHESIPIGVRDVSAGAIIVRGRDAERVIDELEAAVASVDRSKRLADDRDASTLRQLLGDAPAEVFKTERLGFEDIAEEHLRIRLLRQQDYALRDAERYRQARISGPAGTGKTLIARELCRRFLKKGSVLFVCHNIGLADAIARSFDADQSVQRFTGTSGFFSNHFDALFNRIVDGSGDEPFFRRDPLTDAVKNELKMTAAGLRAHQLQQGLAFGSNLETRFLLEAALSRRKSIRFDAVVVDEGQDLGHAKLIALRSLLRDPKESPFLVFYDSNQAIYKDFTPTNVFGPETELEINCRNARPIHDTFMGLHNGGTSTGPRIPGPDVEFLEGEFRRDQARAIVDYLRKITRQPPGQPKMFSRDQVTVLVLGNRKGEHYRELSRAAEDGGVPLVRETHAKRDAVLVDDAWRFKGLESDALVLWLGEGWNEPWQAAGESHDFKKLLYVGLSRAKRKLTVVGRTNSIAHFKDVTQPVRHEFA